VLTERTKRSYDDVRMDTFLRDLVGPIRRGQPHFFPRWKLQYDGQLIHPVANPAARCRVTISHTPVIHRPGRTVLVTTYAEFIETSSGKCNMYVLSGRTFHAWSNGTTLVFEHCGEYLNLTDI
jgi:hypothetical protein